MPREDRDRQFEQALARHLRDEAAHDSACLDAETLAAFHERMLSDEEMLAAKNHVSGCARCQEILAQLESTQELPEIQERDLVPAVLASPRAVRAQVAIPGAPQEAPETVDEMPGSPFAAAAVQQKKFSALKWAAPFGAIAATLLLFAGFREYSDHSNKLAQSQIARNRQEKSPQAGYISPAAPLDGSNAAKQALNSPAKEEAKSSRAGLSSAPLSAPKPGAGKDQGKRGDSGEISADSTRARSVPGTRTEALQAAPDQVALDAMKARPEAQDKADGSQARPTAAAPPPTVSPLPPPSPSETLETRSLGKVAREKAGAAAGASTGNSDEFAAEKKKQESAMVSANLAARALSPLAVASPDGSSIWRFGANGLVAHSSDAGRTFASQSSGVEASLTSGSAPSAKICWIAGTAGTLLRTTDGGRIWKIIPTPIEGDLGGVRAVDRKRASIWDAGNKLTFLTSDGGSTWTKTASH